MEVTYDYKLREVIKQAAYIAKLLNLDADKKAIAVAVNKGDAMIEYLKADHAALLDERNALRAQVARLKAENAKLRDAAEEE